MRHFKAKHLLLLTSKKISYHIYDILDMTLIWIRVLVKHILNEVALKGLIDIIYNLL